MRSRTPRSSKGSRRSRPGGGSVRGFSSKPLTDVPKGAVAIERSVTLLRGRRRGGAGRGRLAGTGVLLLHVEQHREDLAGGGRRRLGAEAALLERRDDHVARVRIRRERRVPG